MMPLIRNSLLWSVGLIFPPFCQNLAAGINLTMRGNPLIQRENLICGADNKDLEQLCAKTSERFNMQCECLQHKLRCGHSNIGLLRTFIEYCMRWCICGNSDDTIRDRDQFTCELPLIAPPNIWIPDSPFASEGSASSGSNIRFGQGFASYPTQPSTCYASQPRCPDNSPGTCMAVTRACSHGSSRTCYAGPVGVFFWHKGACGPTHDSFRRNIKRDDYSPTSTSKYHQDARRLNRNRKASLLHHHNATAWLNGILHHRFPYPCKASYVSFACGNISDGVVHEPREKWLGRQRQYERSIHVAFFTFFFSSLSRIRAANC